MNKKIAILLTLILTLISFSCSKDINITKLDCNSDSEILFISRRISNSADWQIYIMDCNGNNQRTLLDKIVRYSRPICSHDGSKIAFTTYVDKTYYLYIIDKEGQNLNLLSTGEQYCGNPAFSFDDTKIVFSKNDNTVGHNSDIYVINIDGSNETKLTNQDYNTSPSWFPSGNKIIFASFNDTSCGIYTMNSDGTEKKLLTPPDQSFWHPVISPVGNKIALVTKDWDGSQIYVMDSDGKNLKQLTFTVSPNYSVAKPRDANKDPRWSPSGDKIAYVSWEDGDPEIFIINPDGTGKKRLTNTSSRDENPYWSTDDRYILFSSGRDQGMNTEIYIMRADGTEQTALSKYSGDDTLPLWLK